MYKMLKGIKKLHFFWQFLKISECQNFTKGSNFRQHIIKVHLNNEQTKNIRTLKEITNPSTTILNVFLRGQNFSFNKFA